MIGYLLFICLILPFGQSSQTKEKIEVQVTRIQKLYGSPEDIKPVIKNSGNQSIFISSYSPPALLMRYQESTGVLENCWGGEGYCATAWLSSPPIEIKPGEELPVKVAGAVPSDGQPCFLSFKTRINGQRRTGIGSQENSQPSQIPVSALSKKWKYRLVVGYYVKTVENDIVSTKSYTVESDWFEFEDK